MGTAMTNANDLHTRLIHLETRLAFQDDTIDTLNAVVTRLQTTVDRLTHEVAILRAQLQAVAPPLSAGAANEKPPHY